MLLLRRLYFDAQLGYTEGPFLSTYDRFLECVRASFEAEERLQSAQDDAKSLRCAHRKILCELAQARHALRTCGQVSSIDLLHCLDALVIHMTVDDVDSVRGNPGARSDWLSVPSP